MKMRNFTKLVSLVALAIILSSTYLIAQWSGAYGNEWLAGKYGQPWVKVSAGVISEGPRVLASGVYRISMNSASLPASIKNANKSLIQLWHRGKQVDIIKADDTEILFYAVPNDGKSDELLYRPISSRTNPYYSMYSDESSYFLTVGASNGARAVQEVLDNPSATVLDYNVRTESKNYQNEYSHALQDPMRPLTSNSFFEDGKSRTGSKLYDNENNPIFSNFDIQLKSKYGTEQPQVKILLHGRSYFSPRNIHVYVGKNSNSLREAGQVSIPGFTSGEYTFTLQAGDLDNTGKGVLGFSSDASPQTFDDFLLYDTFSVTYYNVIYKQTLDMQNATSTEFVFPAAAQGTQNKIVVNNLPAGVVKFYDISDPDKPRVINGSPSNLTFSRPNNNDVKLLATNQEPYSIADSKITSVEFIDINKSAYNYLIVSNNTLLTSSEAFRKYRAQDSPGTKYKAGVFKITDIYNQFNYGEPSPVAIRRFVDYMISDGNRNKFLLLMGKSITRNDRMVRELPDEVPTVGFPGSDALLVDGLGIEDGQGGKVEDVQAISVGRIPAINNDQALAYLAKVSTYENANTGLAWRKKIVHVSGGKSLSEVGLHANNLSTAGQYVTGSFGGNIDVRNKTEDGDVIQQLDISSAVNQGVGMITYFGHSSTYQTDYNFGYVSDAAKGYDNKGKYPILYYNGCDVLSVFANNFSETVNSSSSRAMSIDWLLSADKGAIAVFGNSWAGFASSCNNYLQKLYPLMYSTNDNNRQTIGQIIQATSFLMKTSFNYRIGTENARVAAYIDNRAQVHQTLLLGDPALKILNTTEGGLPVELSAFEAKLLTPGSVEVSWKTSSEKNNSHFIVERSYNAKNFDQIGIVEGKGDAESESSYIFYDSNPLSGTSYYRLVQVDRDKGIAGTIEVGKKTVSRIVSINRPSANSLVLSPNPSSDWIEIKLDLPVNVKNWNLVDMKGHVIKKNETGKILNLINLPAGEYILEVFTQNGDSYSKKFVKQ